MRVGLRIAVALVLVGFVGLTLVGAADEKPKYTIKDVMKKAMKGGLCKKCASGMASDDEKKELVEMFEAMAKGKPPQGEEESWKKKTKALVDAAKLVAKGDEGAGKKLGGAANCKSCHDIHKGG